MVISAGTGAAVGAAISGLLGAGSSIYSGSKSYATSKKLWGWQNNYDKWLLKNQYQEMSKDLDKAGINPVLWAANSSFNPNAQSHAASMPDTSGYNITGAINSATQLYGVIKNIENSTKLTDAQAINEKSQALKNATEARITGKYGEQEKEALIQSLIGSANQSSAAAKKEENFSGMTELGGEIGKDIGRGYRWVKNKINSAKSALKKEGEKAKSAQNVGEFYKNLMGV